MAAPRRLDARLKAMYTVQSADESGPLHTECAAATDRVAIPTYLVATRASEAWLHRAGALLALFGLCGDAWLVDRALNASESIVEYWLSDDPEPRIGPNAGRARWRDVDATGSHFRAILHSAERGVRSALFLEEDVEFWAHPHEFGQLMAALSRADDVSYTMLGGCWGIHADPEWQWLGGGAKAEFLPAGSRLFLSPVGSRHATRCGHAYTVSGRGARLLLALAETRRPIVETFSHFLNSLHVREPALVASLLEPPIGCQVRGPVRGARHCFSMGCGDGRRAPVRILPPLPGEEGVVGCSTPPQLERAVGDPDGASQGLAKEEL